MIVFEDDEETSKIRCKECLEANPLKTDWLTRGAAKRHLDAIKHNNNVQDNIHRREIESLRQEHLVAPYSAPGYAHLDPQIVPAPETRANLFTSEDILMPDLIHCDDGNDTDDDDGLFNIIIPAGVEPLADHSAREQERLKCEVELLMMQAEEDDLLRLGEDDDDATITNIADRLGSLGMSRTSW